jgi:hypothetical protein
VKTGEKTMKPKIVCETKSRTRFHTLQEELDDAQKRWGPLCPELLSSLKALIEDYQLSVKHGDFTLLSGSWYVTHSGLLRIARRKCCAGIQVSPATKYCDRNLERWAFKATVYKSKHCRGFVGYGDADPSNVSPLVRGAEMRVAETRAVNRALRKAYGIGICWVEETGSSIPPSAEKLPAQNANGNGHSNGSGPKVRDRLCQIIRQHKLDPELVKAYAVDFCGTKTLRDATREQVENFVKSLADWAEKDHNALLCQLNSYAHPEQEVVA